LALYRGPTPNRSKAVQMEKPKRRSKLTTYSGDDFEQIAAAIGTELGVVLKYEMLFEWAADWYALDRGLPRDDPRPRRRPTPPSKMGERLRRIAKRARHLLDSLEVKNRQGAYDGAASFEIVEILATAEKSSEDAVVNATGRIEQLLAIMEAIESAGELERRARQAAGQVVSLSGLIVPKGHQGDAPVNNWIAAMLGVYQRITGVKPATSVIGGNQPNEGIPSGPLIRFLQAAGKPLNISYSEDAWRSRVRTILDFHKN
jgi:hypothetical protein